MKKGLLLSIALHGLVVLLFVGVSFVFPTKPIPQSKVVLDVELAVVAKIITKKTQVKRIKANQSKESFPKKKNKLKKKNKKITIKPKKKVVKPKKKVKLKAKKKNTKVKPVKKIILKPVKKVSKHTVEKKKKVVKSKNLLKAKKDLKAKKGLKMLDKSKQAITDKNSKTTTTMKKNKPKKITNNTEKKSLTKSKTNIQDGKLNIDDLIQFRNQIKECWNVPAGVQDAKNLVTKVIVKVKQNGVVADAKVYWTSKSLTDPFMNVMSESALRAILSDQCSPLKLPKEKYKQWKEMIITFDPKEML